jgi:hypothetical protein
MQALSMSIYVEPRYLTSPHHWVVKQEHYDKTTPSKEEQQALTFKRFDPKFWFKIATSSKTEHWGN